MNDAFSAERGGERREGAARAVGVLQVGLERGVAGANKSERQVVKKGQSVLRRNQTTRKNSSMFDRMKKDLAQAQKLLRILPSRILSPDDVARLFPGAPELFDVVIVDEASQVDLPSLVPIGSHLKSEAPSPNCGGPAHQRLPAEIRRAFNLWRPRQCAPGSAASVACI